MRTPDKKLFRDMQEHPERYSDQELEAMMDDLDQTPDVEQAWQEFQSLTSHTSTPLAPLPTVAGKPIRLFLLRKVAAIFVGIILFSGIAFAAIHFLTRQAAPTSQSATPTSTSSPLITDSSTPVRFDDVRLDSILTVVAAHYDKAVLFLSDETRDMKFFLTWEPDEPLADFIEGMNMFDGLHLTLQSDTIFVETLEKEVDAR